MSRLRIAIVGAGSMGQAHLAVVQRSASCTVSALVDPSPAAAHVAQLAGVPLYPTLDQLIERDRPDGLILATPNTLHADQALWCIARGVPALIEKPLAATVPDALAIVEAVDRTGAKVLVGHHRAHSPIMAHARQLVADGRLGPIVAVMGSALFYKPDQYFVDGPWRTGPGAGRVLLNMIHEVHNLRMLCGDIAAVQALGSRHTRGFPVEDTVAITLRFASGALGTFMLSDTAASARSWEQTSKENPIYAHYDDEDCYVIAGTFGSLAIPTMRLKTWGKADDRSWRTHFDVGQGETTREDPLARQLAHFADVIRDDVTPLVSARDGLCNVRVTQAILDAVRAGTTITISPD
ncbi:Gfo/Idh/MocA family protein [Pigmentiphaga litoralis]|uniref:Putative dehydrogenase n=1 Tax=Pigmentiphaga litoralis TaxID=516702 RepID=A0A7Y9IUS4_9BURK|nr:Gfo/Idh/MocA family oxidoreductase [Pigmentiphaga litoralis]NYE23518.1 putative dehydrogenase [Pigmentiphaga litoralis]NYE82868.1 putative dehydrogenase [Pigmentiphaga litoralis]